MSLKFVRSSWTRWLAGTLLGVALVGALIPPALALPIASSGDPAAVFELDGNAVTDNSTTGLPDDWDRVCHSVLGTDCSTSNNANTTTLEFASQGAATGTTFAGGGSKDPLDISGWAWNQAAGGLPGKDILLNGFAARYTVASTGSNDPYCPIAGTSPGLCSVIFFGMDRFDNSGDAQNGFWFFQNPISLGTTKIGGGESFVGVHKNGDVLIVSDFSVGGTTSTISVYQWNNACTGAGKPLASCADTNLQLLGTSTAANCATAANNAAFCGIVNETNDTTSPWTFLDKSGHTKFQQGEFYEGGINLSAFPGLAQECFASTLAESRSSTSTSATLKSFVLGNFGTCGSSTKTTPQDSTGTDITSISIGTGSVSVQDKAEITVTGAASWSGTVTFNLCGPADLASQPTCLTGGTQIGTSQTVSGTSSTPVAVTSSVATVTSAAAATGATAGNYCWRADFVASTTGVPDSFDSSSTECFTVTPVTPTLTTQASAAIQLGQLISDSATLSGTANEPGTPVINPTTAGSPAKGTLTITAYGPNDCTTNAFSATVNVNGDGTYSSGTFKPTAVGTYTFVASYSGDSPNTNAVPATACPDTSGKETVKVTDTTGITTAQTWVPNDSATITSTGGSALSGSATLTLYDSNNCTGTALYTTGSVPVSGSSPQTINSNNTTKVSVSKSVSWQSVYTSDNTSISGSTSNCEVTSLTITN